MSTNKDGGPAFPRLEHNRAQSVQIAGKPESRTDYPEQFVTVGGMTMRQYYKSVALGSIEAFLLPYVHGSRSASAASRVCGEIADAMLAEDEEHAKK